MIIDLFLKGWLVGFSVAMPVGPIAMLCIQHAVMRGMLYGFVAALGAALADGLYGILAGLGITLISSFLVSYQMWFHLIGAIFLWFLGWSIVRSKPYDDTSKALRMSLTRVFLTTFLLTLTNPFTIFCFAGICATLGIGSDNSGFLPAFTLAFGVMVGSAAWGFLLSSGASILGKRWNIQSMFWLNRISGSTIMLFALVASVAIFKKLLF